MYTKIEFGGMVALQHQKWTWTWGIILDLFLSLYQLVHCWQVTMIQLQLQKQSDNIGKKIYPAWVSLINNLMVVLYVTFGSFTHFDQNQFHELALGLDLTNRPFLWVVRQDNKKYTLMNSWEVKERLLIGLLNKRR